MELNFGTTDRVINMTGMFRGCTALTDTAAFGGTPTYPSGAGTFIYMNETYNGCTSLTGATAPANFINNRVVSLLGTFWDCTSFVGSVAMCSWDTSNVGEFCGSGGVAVGSRGTFQNTLFNQPVVQAAAPHWDFTSATRTSKMFPPAFTNGGQQVVFKPLTNTGTLDCREMFRGTGCNDFDIDFDTTGAVGTIQADDFFPAAGWDNSLAGCHIKRIIAPGFRHYSTSWSQANFNATIEAWGVTFSGDAPAGWIVDVTGSPITFAGTTGAALTGYTYLTGTQGWTFIGTGF